MQIDPSLHSVADNYKLLTNLVGPRPFKLMGRVQFVLIILDIQLNKVFCG